MDRFEHVFPAAPEYDLPVVVFDPELCSNFHGALLSTAWAKLSKNTSYDWF
jgi:hypothetical protein